MTVVLISARILEIFVYLIILMTFLLVKKTVKYFPINVSYEWRVNLLKELLSIKRNPHHLEGFSFEEVEIFIENLACS